MLAENSYGATVVVTNGAAPVEPVGLAAARSEPAALAASPAPQERHRQSQKQLAMLDAVEKMLTGLANADAPFQAAMVKAGLIEGYLAECRARYAAAEEAIEVRHVAMIEALAATEQMQAAEFQARAAYSAFRQIARTVVTSSSGRAALKLDERTPVHREVFLRTAEAALTAAQGEPYATLLSAATFDAERVAETLATLEPLMATATAQEIAHHRAKQATAERDAAMRELATVTRQIKVEVKTLVRRNPALTLPVGFAA
jgi:hypothetical protein